MEDLREDIRSNCCRSAKATPQAQRFFFICQHKVPSWPEGLQMPDPDVQHEKTAVNGPIGRNPAPPPRL